MWRVPPRAAARPLVTTIPLPGPEGHGDWVAFDRGDGDIYLSHHGSNMVVLDTKTNKIVANIESRDLDTPDVMAFDSLYRTLPLTERNSFMKRPAFTQVAMRRGRRI